ncbi:hypothetical protein EHS25_009973 [Saitozyma podzolica]|uniref:Haloacid dehalogenase, type II n=1 Tax=Saitozyma podzolica TaxID=1890683 RepID=A0A427YI89_9TREE|nr:hypothetical protein EHS25_009973 [Saitozyma podzolica]
MPSLTVCFDALGTCFSLDPLVRAVDELLGERLVAAGQGARTVVHDWFHSAQRDYTYLSMSRPPPPPISQVLTLTLPRALTFALTSTQSTSTSLETPLPDLTPITSKLTELTAAPGLAECFTTISRSGGKIIIVTNGSKGTTEGYAEKAGVRSMVHAVVSCDEVGLAKPHREVYDAALLACSEADAAGERWFVAAHAWDFQNWAGPLRTAPQGTGDRSQLDAYWDMYGGIPDVVGRDLEEVADGIIKRI